MARYTAPRGTNDFIPPRSERMMAVLDRLRTLFARYRFRPIETPVFEETELFTRSVGEETDIVSKEMYTFLDRKGRSLTLRPEGTASVVRAYVEGNLDRQDLGRLYYVGPMFRYERPQKGRYRQFFQVGVESLGEGSALADVELIALFCHLGEELGLEGLQVELNSVGCPVCRETYMAGLRSRLDARRDVLCGDCNRRLETNPLRVLDCKVPACQEPLSDLPHIVDELCPDCAEHFAATRDGLEALGIRYELNPRLVRGLDYYTRTAFEVTCRRLGAQSAVGGGGRYDLLVEQLGGRPTPAIGFAIGLERLLLLLGDDALPGEEAPDPLIWVGTATGAARNLGSRVVHGLRRAGWTAQLGMGTGNLGKQMKLANRNEAAVAVLIGEDELASGRMTLKHMAVGEQLAVAEDELEKQLLRWFPGRRAVGDVASLPGRTDER